MAKKIRSQNFFVAQTTGTIPASGSFSVTLNQSLSEDRGFIVLDVSNTSLREVVYYDSKSGSQINVKAENRSNPQAHAIGAYVQVNDVAEFQNYVSDIASSFGYIEKTGGLTLQVWGGYVVVNNTSALISDTNFTLPASQTSYIWFDPVTNTFIQTLNSVTITGTRIATVITGASTISSITQEVASFGTMAGVDNDTIEYDGTTKKLKIKRIPASAIDIGLNGLNDVTISTPINGQALIFNGTEWVNNTPTTGGDMFNSQNLSGLTNPATARVNLGLGNVDNTSDVNKPVSAAQAIVNAGQGIVNSFKANLASPTFTGTVTVPTPSNSTDASTKGYVDTAVATKKTDSISTNKLLGRGTAGTGVIEEITLGTNLSLTGTTLNATGGGGSGTVTNVSSATADATITNPTTTPAITIVSAPKLTTARNINGVAFDGTGNITVADATKQPLDAGLTSISALTGSGYVKATATDTFSQVTTIPNTDITGLGTLATQSGTFSGTSSGTNTGDNAVNNLYSGLVSNATHTGDATGATVLTLATVNSNVGSFGLASSVAQFVVNAKGLITSAVNVAISIASTAITDFASASRAQTEAELVAGTNITITPSGSGATRQLTIASSGGGGGSLTTQDEGTTLSTAVTTLNFVGAGVTASGAGATTTVTIPGAAGGNAGYQKFTSSGQTVFTLTTFTYTPADKGLSVYVNGLRQTITTDYTETSSTVITFTSTVTSGNVVEFVYAVGVGATGPAGTGGIIRSVNNISTNTTGLAVANTDYVYLCTATLTLTLPTAVGNTNRYIVKNIGGTTTVGTTSSQTIDGSTTATISVQYTSLEIVSDGANWNII